jgi:hypothetical protein
MLASAAADVASWIAFRFPDVPLVLPALPGGGFYVLVSRGNDD